MRTNIRLRAKIFSLMGVLLLILFITNMLGLNHSDRIYQTLKHELYEANVNSGDTWNADEEDIWKEVEKNNEAYQFSMLLFLWLSFIVVLVLGWFWIRTIEKRMHMERIYRLIAENTSDLVCLIDRDEKVEYMSPSHQSILGIIPQSFDEFRSILHEEDQERFDSELNQLKQILRPFVVEIRVQRGNDQFVWLEMLATPIVAQNGNLQNIVISSRKIMERKKYEEKLQFMAYYDVLTNLPNRRLFKDRLELALSHAKRYHHMVAIAYLDCDRFKQLNDTFGHDAGDMFLKELAERLKSSLRDIDTVARMGGDEFTLLLPEIASRDDAVMVTRRVMDAFQQQWEYNGNVLFMTGSLGVVLFPNDGEDLDVLMRKVDHAMYYAKRQGRNRIQFYDEIHKSDERDYHS